MFVVRVSSTTLPQSKKVTFYLGMNEDASTTSLFCLNACFNIILLESNQGQECYGCIKNAKKDFDSRGYRTQDLLTKIRLL